MAHRFVADGGTTFNYDGGFDEGSVVVIEDAGNDRLHIPLDDLKQFIAESVRYKRQSEIENASTEDLLS